jgi:glycosyltransferase involved in cell wall biosynthesis
MSRIAILLSCDSFEKFFGGVFKLDRNSYVQDYSNDFAWSYGKALHARGHQVFLYVLSYGPAELRTAPSGLQVRFIPMPLWSRLADSLLYRAQRLPGGAMRRDRVAYGGYRRALARGLAEDGIEILYNQELWSPRFLLLLRDIAVPVIGADHGQLYDPALDGARRVAFPRACALVCQTTENLNLVQALGGKGVLIPNGVDPAFFHPGEPPLDSRRKTILAVGRLVEPQKRFSDLIHALVLLPDFSLTLAGTGPDAGMLKDLVRDLGLLDRVTFTGFVSDPLVLRQLYREARVFVSSSAWEAVALVALEAMSCGTPVVATRIPSFEALLEGADAGLLVPVGEPAQLAAAIQAVHEDAEVLGKAARVRIEQHYADGMLYDQLCSVIDGCAPRRT